MPSAEFFTQDIMTKRPEQLTVAQFVELTNIIEKELSR
jgi:16S rRNA (adenine1518-N6/adenine1519-N6)-dimethyltransferase